MPLLTVDNLATSFHTRNGVVRAVGGISYEVEKGRTLGIVGESGCGKSVSCYSLLGLIPMPPGKIESGSAVVITARFDRVALARHGLRTADVGETLEIALRGVPVTQVLDADAAYDLVVRFAGSAAQDVEQVGNTG